jgi:hypothetical protein
MTSNSVKAIEKLVEVDSGAGKDQKDKIRLMMMILMMTTTMTSVFASFFITLYKATELLRRTDIFPQLIWAPKKSCVKFLTLQMQ